LIDKDPDLNPGFGYILSLVSLSVVDYITDADSSGPTFSFASAFVLHFAIGHKAFTVMVEDWTRIFRIHIFDVVSFFVVIHRNFSCKSVDKDRYL